MRNITIIFAVCLAVFISSDLPELIFGQAGLPAKVTTAQRIEPSRAHVRHSPEAEALVKTAARAVRDRDWRTASENYQKAIELYSQYLINASVPDDKTEKDNHDLYWGVGHFCRNALRNLPPEGMKVYNGMFGPAAKHAFENAVRGRLDREKLAQVAELYGLTESGRQALALLMRWHLERGDLYKASGYYRELKLDHPQGAQGLPERGLIEEFMAGKPSGVEWQAYCGDNTRSKMMPAGPIGGSAEGHSFPWAGYYKLPDHVVNLSRRLDGPDIYERVIPQESIPYFPVVNKGVIYLPAGLGIYVFELSTPVRDREHPLERSELPESKDAKLPYDLSAPMAIGTQAEMKVKWKVELNPEVKKEDGTSGRVFQEERVINTAALSSDGRRLYVPLISSFEKQEERLGFLDVKYPFPRRVLFCFDTATAKALWTSDRVPYFNGDDNPCEDVIFPVAPAEESGVIYVAGIRMPSQVDIPEQYLYAMNACSGAVYFKTFICSGILEANLFNNPSREPIASAVTVDKDNIYYCSQIGAIVAADKYSGQIKWLKKYEEYQIKPTWPDYTPPRLLLRWVNNQIIRIDDTSFAAAKGQIIATAIDSPFLYVLSSEDGAELWRWNGDESPLGNVRYLLGVKDGFLAISGESCLICLNLNKNGKLEWKVEGGRFNGKSAITEDKIYITSDYTLMEIALKTGKLISRNILQGREEIQPAANLLVVGDLLIRNSIGQMNIYRIEDKKEQLNEPIKK